MRTTNRLLICVALLAAAGAALAGPGKAVDLDRGAAPAPIRVTFPERSTAGLDRLEHVAIQEQLQGWLFTEMPAGVLTAPLSVEVTDADLAEIERADREDPGKTVVGLVKPLGTRVDLGQLASLRGIDAVGAPFAGGVVREADDGGLIWAAAVGSAGARAIRLHFTDVALPSSADLFIFSLEGQAFGPYREHDVWANTLFGDTAIVQLRVYGADGRAELAGAGFTIADVGHIGAKFLPGVGIGGPTGQSVVAADDAIDFGQAASSPVEDALAFCSYNDTCIENTSCGGGPSWGAKAAAEDATALMLWTQGPFLNTCTGGLVADTDGSSAIPYVLTANHCISRGRDANKIEFYFRYSVGCGSGCPGQWQGGGIQVSPTGAQLLSTSSTGDYTLLQMNGTPPSGSAYMGWTTSPVAFSNGTQLYRISHPSTAPQAYSSHTVDTSAGTCSGIPRGSWIYSRDVHGATEGGSSGSPVYNGAGQIVGQLTGACGFNTGDVCDSSSNATIDGAFASYYGQIASWLDPTPCTPSAEVCDDGADNDCDGAVDCDDSDCSGDPACDTGGGCTLGQPGDSCTSDSDCCSNKCKGSPSNRTCR